MLAILLTVLQMVTVVFAIVTKVLCISVNCWM